jgi:hypothetical protein
MSRFDRSIRRVELGPCSCPGTPHSGDWMELKRAPWGAVLEAREQTNTDAFYTVALACITGWNLLDEGSDTPVPITMGAIDALDAGTFQQVMTAVGEAMPGAELPNASGAPSPPSASAESAASPIPTIETP